MYKLLCNFLRTFSFFMYIEKERDRERFFGINTCMRVRQLVRMKNSNWIAKKKLYIELEGSREKLSSSSQLIFIFNINWYPCCINFFSLLIEDLHRVICLQLLLFFKGFFISINWRHRMTCVDFFSLLKHHPKVQ